MDKFKYAFEQRLRLIDFLLARYGHVGRGEIIDFFGIASACATRDLAEYKRLAPANLVYDTQSKTYIVTHNFKRVWG